MSKELWMLLAKSRDLGIISWASRLLLAARASPQVPWELSHWKRRIPQLVPMDLSHADGNKALFFVHTPRSCFQVVMPGQRILE